MSHRRRHRWLRRLALGLAFAAFATPAAAKFDESSPGARSVTAGGSAVEVDPFLTDIHVRQGESLGGPDGSSQPAAATGLDDLARRFAQSDVAAGTELASSRSRVEWDDALSIGIAGIVLALALALGLGLGRVRRPTAARA